MAFGILKQYVIITVHIYFVLNVIKLCKLKIFTEFGDVIYGY